ncbi:beta-N-acetylhexosaminidase [Yinghuangia seranimata]|uniref:beta-N-acetylhexosaminidase n=1 Tax=Yinghuangia seranimata TaxID=408067 RepID=UPI00248CE6F0|nr:beta-N-acetylhexosaminidase [Yinghuangia seranimata]MDI2132812.1 beta-N-acetylhexosaminidase [Yinghuangia seranimata]
MNRTTLDDTEARRRLPVPLPRRLEWRDAGAFRLDAATRLCVVHGDLDTEIAWLRAATGLPLPLTDDPRPGVIQLTVDPDLPDEGYRLRVGGEITVAGGPGGGVFRGLQTLRQLLPPSALRRARIDSAPWDVPHVAVDDEPRYAWRGVLLDVVRHFLPKADVLRFLDLMAQHHLNVLHLHLTDDQGWRFEVPGWPRLVEVGAWRAESMVGTRHTPRFDGRPHGGYYTRDDLREIVAYAADRHITVVPEVDLPGHAQAVLAAYPELAAGEPPSGVRTGWGISDAVLTVTDEALAFCRDVLAEVCAVFPSRYVCVGGDEVPRGPWRADPAAAARAAELGLPDTDGLQRWFTARLAELLAGHGRVLFGWDEVLEDGAPDGALIGGWRGEHGVRAAARRGFDVVACPDTSVYLDYRQADGPDEPIPIGTLVRVEDVHRFEPVPDGLTAAEAAHVLGGQAALWSEQLDSARAVDYAAFPRLAAFAEALWTPGPRDTDEFTDRLARDHLPRLDALGVEYRPLAGPHPWQTRPDAPGHPRQRADREAELLEMTARLREG